MLAFGLWLYLRGSKDAGLLLLGLSMSVKPTAAVILPVLLLGERGWRRRLAVPLIPLLVLVLQFVPYVGGPGVFDGLFRFARDWVFNGSVFGLVHAIVGDNQRARLVCGVLFGAVLAGLCVGSRDVASTSVSAVFLLLLCSPVVHPFTSDGWRLLPPIAPRGSGLALVGTVSLTSLTFVTDQLEGVWVDYPLVRAIEYLPVVALLLKEAAARPARRPA